jgi:hypothetical protein
MNASTIINDNMTLDEKLAAIEASVLGMNSAPLDPQDLLMCEGCQ